MSKIIEHRVFLVFSTHTYALQFCCLLVVVYAVYAHQFPFRAITICRPFAPRSLPASPLIWPTPTSWLPSQGFLCLTTCPLNTEVPISGHLRETRISQVPSPISTNSPTSPTPVVGPLRICQLYDLRVPIACCLTKSLGFHINNPFEARSVHLFGFGSSVSLSTLRPLRYLKNARLATW